jgi:N-methylhydantoinase B
MPADQETIRYTGVYGTDADGLPYLMREVLGGGSGGRYYADGEDTIHVVPDSRNIPVEFAEARWPFRVEKLGLAVDSGGPGRHRGGLGYEKHIRMLRDAEFMSIADRSILACWGVKGGRAGRPFEVVIDPGGPAERVVDALADAEPVRAGEVIRIRTTGGGGWGDPLERPVQEVVRDVRWGKVSAEGALRDYGVVLASVRPSARPDALEVAFGLDRPASFRAPASAPEEVAGYGVDSGCGVDSGFEVDVEATEELRETMRATRGSQPFFDRGPGFATLARGATSSDFDWL